MIEAFVLVALCFNLLAMLWFKRASDRLVKTLMLQVEQLAGRLADLSTNDEERTFAQNIFQQMRKRRLHDD